MLSRSRTDEERQMLEHMAATWESLAKDRKRQIDQQRRIADLAGIEGPLDSN